MDCVTPSQPMPIPHGVSQTILDTLSETKSGTLFKDGKAMSAEQEMPQLQLPVGHTAWTPSSTKYRSSDLSFLLAQNATSERALKQIEREALTGQQWDWSLGSDSSRREPLSSAQPRRVHRAPRVVTSVKRAPRTASRPERPVTSIPLRRAPDTSSRLRD